MTSRRFILATTLALLLSSLLFAGNAGAQQAGKISVVVPTAYLVRASQQLPAAPSSPVNWGDVINTGHLSRVRVSLTDGSILNVGSDSNLTIAKHDAAAQQTDLDLTYGRVRAKAVKLAKPDARFQIRTSVGVAGVVGTEMIVAFESSPDNAATAAQGAEDLRKMSVYCLEGHCKICDLGGHCVTLNGGQFSSIRGNSAPAQPAPMTPVTVTQAVNATSVGTTGATVGATGATTIAAVGTAIGTGVAVGVVRAVATTTTCPPPATGGALGTRMQANCTRLSQGTAKK
jgi:hypothetical protein